MKKAVFFLSILFLAGFVYAVPAYNNLHVNIQVTYSNGSIQTGTFAFVFNISNSSNCASANVVYSNSTTLTTDSRGLISYYLPNVNLDYTNQYWLCYYKDGVLTDTSELARVPSAFQARNVSAVGVIADSNLNLGSYNLTALNLFGDGSQLTNLPTGSGVPVGTISAFNLSSCPIGWTPADGTSGTPDLRGIFIRGSGTNSILQYANSSLGNFSATLGAYGNDSLQGHYHRWTMMIAVSSGLAAGSSYNSISSTDTAITIPVTDGTNGVPRTGKETTPAYYATIYCIKTAEDTPVSNTIWAISGNNIVQNNVSKNVLLSNNITADYFIGDGSQLTGISGNANISDYYRTYDTGWISRSDWTNVELGSNTTKNADSNLTHNLNAPLSELSVRVLISQTGSDSDSTDFGAPSGGYGAGTQYGVAIYQVDNNTLKIQTGAQGLVRTAEDGSQSSFDTEDWYYKIIVSQVIALNSTPLFGGTPANAIMAFNQASCPNGWILADGTSGTPDLRGIFLRGSGVNGILNYANSTYGGINATYGIYGNDSLQGHYHNYHPSSPLQTNGPNSVLVDSMPSAGGATPNADRVKAAIADGTNGAPRTGKETTPAYYATIYCIKTAEDTTSSNTIWGTSGNNIVLNNASQQVSIQTNLTVGSATSQGNVNFSNASTIYYAPNASEPSWGTLHTCTTQYSIPLAGGTSPSAGTYIVTVPTSSVPVGAKAVLIWSYAYHSSSGIVSILDGAGNYFLQDPEGLNEYGSFQASVPINSSRQFQIILTQPMTQFTATVVGYYI